MQSRRIFLAIDISDTVRALCDRHIGDLRRGFPDVKVGWESSEKLHITMKFLGNTSGQLLDQLKPAVAEIAANHEAFKLRLSRPGVFPRATRPRVLWIGIDDRPGAVSPIFAELESLCDELGFAKETRAFRPHITIGRVRNPDDAVGLADAHLSKKIEPVEFEVREIVIYESTLQPAGSIYSVLSSAKLQPVT